MSWFAKNFSTFIFVLFVGVIAHRAFQERAVPWKSDGGLYRKAGDVDIDDYLAFSRQIFSGDTKKIVEYRPTQFIYPLFLAPIHLFSIDAERYVAFLHGLFTVIALVSVFAIGNMLHSKWAGLWSAYLIAANSDMAYWFHWMFTETCYYAVLSVTIAMLVRALVEPKARGFFGFLILGLTLFFIKPEAVVILFVGGSFLYARIERVRSRSVGHILENLAIFWTIIFVLASSSILLSRTIRESLLSHIHISHGLWLTTHTGEYADQLEQGRAYNALSEWTSRLNPAPRDIREHRLMMSSEGIRLIVESPRRFFRHVRRRFVATLFTWKFASGWSAEMITNDKRHTVFLVLGGLLAVILGRLIWPLSCVYLVAIGMTTFVALYHLDGDFRFRLPIQLVLSTVAPIGALSLIQSIRVRIRKIRLEPLES